MKIGIIGAMEEEISLVRNEIKNLQVVSIRNRKIYIGELNNVEIAVLKSGIGKVAAAIGTTILLMHYKPDIIINVGSAGGLVSKLKISDIIISEEVIYHDVDITSFGYAFGQLPNCPKSFIASKDLIVVTEECISKLNLDSIRGLIVSGDTFINNKNILKKIRNNFPQAIAVDMESAAIAHVCFNFGIPFVIIRAISDIAGQQSHLFFNKNLVTSMKHIFLLISSLVKSLKENE